jgi:glycosyltransferase involved in cell wall biosynthesis
MSKKKLLTIIIPTYNSGKKIQYCLRSINKQTFKDFVIYIADGGSTDHTLEIIKNNLRNFRIISKKDNSCEEGINKCLLKIKTKFFMIIGSDDFIDDEKYIENLIITINKSNADIVFPDFGIINNNKKKIIKQISDFSYLSYKTIAPGFGWLGKKDIIRSNKFSTKLKVATDYDFFCKLYKKNFIFLREKKSIYYFRIGGNSFNKAYTGFNEVRLIALKNGGPLIKIYTHYFLSVIKFFVKFNILKILRVF